MTRTARLVTIVLLGFLALTAIPGGVTLMAGINVPSTDVLRGSPFDTFMVPGMALAVVVGGTALVAAVLVTRRHKYARPAGLLAAACILVFETVEVSVIGSPAGVGRVLQAIYFGTGGAIALLVVPATAPANR
jgi:hypothetical protein